MLMYSIINRYSFLKGVPKCLSKLSLNLNAASNYLASAKIDFYLCQT